MSDQVVTVFYMCPKCLEPAIQAEPCPNCGGKRVPCRPGKADDPCRKPFRSPSGAILTRAPEWWLRAIGNVKPDAEAR